MRSSSILALCACAAAGLPAFAEIAAPTGRMAPVGAAEIAATAEAAVPSETVPSETVPSETVETAVPAPAAETGAPETGTETTTPVAYPDFTFHFSPAPPPGQKPGALVQIDPEAQAAFIAARPNAKPRKRSTEAPVVEASATAAAGTVAANGWEWFWEAVSSETSAAGPANVARALRALDTRRELPEPRLQSLKLIADAYGRDILGATVGTKVSPALVLALISVESSGMAKAESHKGAQGLMQLIPATAERFGVKDASDPVQNIKGGVAYLDWLLRQFDSDPILALAGYNAGEGAVAKHGGVPPFAETRAYVPKVLAAWRVARGLCSTWPELITDGCVFVTSG